MAYNIVKGWPSDAAIDEIIVADTGETLTPGFIAMLKTNGKAAVGNYTAAAAASDPQAVFVIDYDKVRTGRFSALASRCVIEVDDSHYAAGSYTPGDLLTTKLGKFSARTGGALETVVARVLSYDATTKKLRVLWLA